MISVMTGSQDMPFPRLVRFVIEGAADSAIHRDDEWFLQAGVTPVGDAPPNFVVVDFCPRTVIAERLARSRYVLTHGGTGSVIGALQAGCRVAIMPRLSALGEHNDDHQVEIAELFERAGYALYCRESDSFDTVFARLATFEPTPYESGFEELKRSIDDDIAEFLRG